MCPSFIINTFTRVYIRTCIVHMHIYTVGHSKSCQENSNTNSCYSIGLAGTRGLTQDKPLLIKKHFNMLLKVKVNKPHFLVQYTFTEI